MLIEDTTAYTISTANQPSILNNKVIVICFGIWAMTTATVSDVYLKIIKQHRLACLIYI